MDINVNLRDIYYVPKVCRARHQFHSPLESTLTTVMLINGPTLIVHFKKSVSVSVSVSSVHVGVYVHDHIHIRVRALKVFRRNMHGHIHT